MTTMINEIMTDGLYTLTPQDSLWEAVQMMNQYRIRHIPVVENGELQGLVSQRDILAHTHKDEVEQKNTLLNSVMKRDIISINEQANIRKAALLLQKHKIGCLPVVQDKKLLGIVTDTDFVAVAINLLELLETTEPLDEEEF